MRTYEIDRHEFVLERGDELDDEIMYIIYYGAEELGQIYVPNPGDAELTMPVLRAFLEAESVL